MITRILIVAITFSLGAMPSAMAKAVDEMGMSIQEVPLDNPFSYGDPDTMAMSYVSSVGVDSFHWYRNNSINGDTFEIDSMTTNVAAPFQISVEIEGSWDFEVHSATAIHVYTAGSGSSAVSVGTLTLGDGYHIIYNDTAAGGSELHIDLPGPSGSSSGSGSGSGCASCPSPSSSSNPLWDDIEAEFAHVEWKMVEGRLQYRFLGNNAASTLYTDLHQPSGSGDIEVSYIGDTSCSSLSMPAELVHDAVSVSSGHHYLQAGTSGSGPWSLYVSWGPAPCEADLNGDGTVDIADLVAMFGMWGGCP
ncbi:MAG: hypothetical protein HOO04_01170 [Phycisphaerae bacterium]|jgi:hypothetical protein|nr:hypothetical protein [Phycisphaerae bacterium]MBT5383246.1 hypothetical protein [Phycisphaerae bacterium]MBT7352152.1 hypothetical protein [Phycisphaerae bacterium]